MKARLVQVNQYGESYRAVLVTLWDNIKKVGEVVEEKNEVLVEV